MNASVEVAATRPLLRWHGGKWRLASWVISHFPEHRVYVEPFGGAASVLIRKERAYAEIFNDLDDELVNLFEVLRERKADGTPMPGAAARLIALLELTAFARTEWENAYLECDDPVERARRLIVRSFMGFGSGSANREHKTGFRANSSRSHTTPALDWRNYPMALPAIIDRLRGVILEHRDAISVMQKHDASKTLHYVDPPYLPETRSQRGRRRRRQDGAHIIYRHEMTRKEHIALLLALKELKGMVVLSGYPSPLYDRLLRGWTRIERAAMGDGATPRIECLWLNAAAANAQSAQAQLFGAVA